MINPKQYKKLKEVIQKANPLIQTRNTSAILPKPFSGIINYRDDTIRLNHVLLTLEKNDIELFDIRFFYPESLQFEKNGKLIAVWNLKEDLDNQSEETKQLLIDLYS